MRVCVGFLVLLVVAVYVTADNGGGGYNDANNGGGYNNGDGADQVRCYDCHYDPSQARRRYRRAGTSRPRGFPQCALDRSDDEWRVDRWPCKSKTCFVRQDHNGLVYRGCADHWNLPWGVDTNKTCEDQGSKPSKYYFCKGNLCNNGKMGSDFCQDNTDNNDYGNNNGYTNDNGYDNGYSNDNVYGNDNAYSNGNSYDNVDDGYNNDKSYNGYGNDNGYDNGNNYDNGYNNDNSYGSDSYSSSKNNNGYSSSSYGNNNDGYNSDNAKSSDNGYNSYYKQGNDYDNGNAYKSDSSYGNGYNNKNNGYDNDNNGYSNSNNGYSNDGYSNNGDYNSKKSVKSVTPYQSKVWGYEHPATLAPPAKVYPSEVSHVEYPDPPRPFFETPYFDPVNSKHETFVETPEEYKADYKTYDSTDYKSVKSKNYKTWEPEANKKKSSSYAQPPPPPPANNYPQSYPDSSYPSEPRQPAYDVPAANTYDAPEAQVYPRQQQEEEKDSYGYESDLNEFEGSLVNPCDGRCHGNPSGLFPNPQKEDWFIQCGDGVEYGKACKCCHPYYLRCPRGTFFEKRTRVCSAPSNISDEAYKSMDGAYQ